MGWHDTWNRIAFALLAGEASKLIPPPPWGKATENHCAGLSAVRYWQAVRG